MQYTGGGLILRSFSHRPLGVGVLALSGSGRGLGSEEAWGRRAGRCVLRRQAPAGSLQARPLFKRLCHATQCPATLDQYSSPMPCASRRPASLHTANNLCRGPSTACAACATPAPSIPRRARLTSTSPTS